MGLVSVLDNLDIVIVVMEMQAVGAIGTGRSGHWRGLCGGIALGEAIWCGVVGKDDDLYRRDALAHKDMHSHGSYLI